MKNSPAVAISAGLWYNTTKESAVRQTVSTFPVSQLQEMIARVEPGSHFLLLKILYAISNAPKPTVASNVSKARVSKSVIEHPKVYSCKQYYSPAVAISAGLWYNITKESAVWQTVSTFPGSQSKDDRTKWKPGGHFLLLKIFHAMSKTPKPTVASNVSKAKVSKSVIEHPPFRCGASGA